MTWLLWTPNQADQSKQQTSLIMQSTETPCARLHCFMLNTTCFLISSVMAFFKTKLMAVRHSVTVKSMWEK